MTAPVPDPRFRDQLAAVYRLAAEFDMEHRPGVGDRIRRAAAEVEARVQAAAQEAKLQRGAA